MTNLTDFIQYFRRMATQHNSIEGFVHGNWDRVLNEERAQLSYPLLWVETPNISVVSDIQAEESKVQFDGAFIILANTADETVANIDSLHNDLLELVYDIIRRMISDADNDEFDFISDNIQIEPIDTFSIDNDLGWRVPFRLIYNSFSRCYEAAKWNDSEPAE
jgi:hypothetical protein